MFRTQIGKQLLLLAVFVTLYVACQTLLFAPRSIGWSAALTTKPWLAAVYFLIAHIFVERVSKSHEYGVRLAARNEGLEYRDEFEVYRFNVARKKRRWIVYLPGSKGEHFMTHELSDEERVRILPRIEEYLKGRRYLGLIGPTCSVTFEREGPVSPAIAASRRQAAKYFEDQAPKK